MKDQAQVVIIGGGIMGVSLLYHLSSKGWNDVILVEKNDLTAGSTWHAAGLCTHYAHNPTIMEMRARSVRMYRDILPEETGLTTGFHPCGALRITRDADRMDEFRQVKGLGRFVGYDFNILSPGELSELYPLCQTDGLLGAIHEPDDGYVDPSMATQAMAAGARARGAQIYRRSEVVGISRSRGREWIVSTSKGEVRAEHIVNAAGTWCRDIGTMMGLDLPVVPMLHQYLVTDSITEVTERTTNSRPELPIIRDPEESWYIRQERDGLIVGPYEKEAVPWSIDGIPAEFGMELLPPDLDRVEHIVARAMERVPALAEAGIKTIVNGPITFTPDANPLIGPAFGLPNAWLLTGSSMGVMEGGGAGEFLANWIIDGSPPMDALAIDGRRFGDYADRNYRLDKAIECFGLQFGVHYPFEERRAGRPRRVTPMYEQQLGAGAVFGCIYGWERPNWFSPGSDQFDAPLTFGKPRWFDTVGKECQNVSTAAGIADLSAFSKFEVAGSGAKKFLDCLGANRPPQTVGHIGLVHALTLSGGVASEFTVTKLALDRFYLTSAAAAERHDEDLLRRRSSNSAGVQIVNRTREVGIIAVMGPNSRPLLERLLGIDLGNNTFPWLTAREIMLHGESARLLRISYVGELGWELHAPVQILSTVYSELTSYGTGFGLQPFGAFAMNSMRLEKGYRAWGLDLTTERTPLEAGLNHLVKIDDRTFTGRDRLVDRATSADAWRMTLLEIDAGDSRVPFTGHCVLQQDKPVGVVTSGAFGFRVGRALALAYLTPEAIGNDFVIDLVGELATARVMAACPYDPGHLRLRDQ